MRLTTAALTCIIVLLLVASPVNTVRAQNDLPALGAEVATWSLKTPSAFEAWTCPTSQGVIAYGDEGLRIRLTGRCRETSTSVGMRSEARRISIADGEIAIDVRTPVGYERARLALFARDQPGEGRAYSATWEPGRGVVELHRVEGASSILLAQRGDLPAVGPDRWTRFAFVLDGPRLWLTLDREPVLFAEDAALDRGTIAVGMTRLGSLEGQAEVVSTWRDLSIAPLAAGIAARAPAIDPSLLPRPAIGQPRPVTPVVRDDLRAPALFWPQVCSTDANTAAFDEEGVRLRVAGTCFAAMRSSNIALTQTDVTLGDGAARVEFRVEEGSEFAGIAVVLIATAADDESLVGVITPSTGIVSLLAESASDARLLTAHRLGDRVLDPSTWTALAIQREGDRAWLLLNDEPVLVADGVPTGRGAPSLFVSRSGIFSDRAEVITRLRNFSAAAVDGSDGAGPNGVHRAPRPVVDPRYERLLAFIRDELAADPGTDAAAAERRAIGQAILDMIAETEMNLEVGPLPEKNAARFLPYRRSVVVDERLMTFTPHVGTTLLLHEIVHAHQERIGQPRGCYDRELDATQWATRLWRAWFGPDGKEPPGDDIEAEFTAAVQLENRGQLRAAIEEIYHEQCEGR